ncbi:heme ABC transporter ATP-binding protein [Putridiphycobacter roseus]|uniref:Heme ABC transporter ATP-binding protein n=1 Tax=Putridiphycobacter roseus TaxID=2219161 RepID=A0A2W1N532_9FLAO|nr:heme ABC transporter ATP-binding protein [Putridiphycobacter roseus]PZE18710.1 heme ABC transporter ATP-binding protein [Putridiphycobacter roseus]
MLKVENLTYKVKDKILIDGITMHFNVGEIAIVLGANGAGKSTLLGLLSGQLKPNSGKLSLVDKLMKDFSQIELAQKRAVLSQHNVLGFPMKVSEVVLMGRYPYFESTASKKDLGICREAMSLFGVEKFADRNMLSLSGGEQQRVHFARVIAQVMDASETQQKILLLDEPLTFLDIKFQLEFMEIIQTFCKTKNVMVVGVLHDLNIALKYADRLFMLKNGQLIAQGKPANIITPKLIEMTFGIQPNIQELNGKIQLYF